MSNQRKEPIDNYQHRLADSYLDRRHSMMGYVPSTAEDKSTSKEAKEGLEMPNITMDSQGADDQKQASPHISTLTGAKGRSPKKLLAKNTANGFAE